MMATHPARIELTSRTAPLTSAPEPGLSSAWVVVPGEDAVEVAGRFAALTAELAPDGDALSLILARHVAALSIRAERAFRHDTAATAARVRHAVADFDEARRAAADRLFAQLADDPAGVGRRLRATPEGCDLILGALRTLREAAADGPERKWTSDHSRTLAQLTGAAADLPRAPGPELVQRLDAEVTRVEADRAILDHTALALDRAEACERALLDSGPAGVPTRRYEAAIERSLFRALTELRVIRRDRAASPTHAEPALRPAPTVSPAPTPPRPAPLASFFPAPSPGSRPTDFIPVAAAAPSPRSGREPIRDRRQRPKLPR